MDKRVLQELIQIAGQSNGRANADNLVAILKQKPELLDLMMEIYLSHAEPASRRVIWAIDLYSEEFPDVLMPYIEALVFSLPKATHDAHRRHALRILIRYPLPLKHLGILISSCFDYLLDPVEPPAVKVYAMELLFRVSEQEPAIKQELIDTIELRMPEGSTGFKNRAEKILRKLYQRY